MSDVTKIRWTELSAWSQVHFVTGNVTLCRRSLPLRSVGRTYETGDQVHPTLPICAECAGQYLLNVDFPDPVIAPSVSEVLHPPRPDSASSAFILKEIVAEVIEEVVRAQFHGTYFNSLHEAFAVILEEVDELWEIVRQKSTERNRATLHLELLQIAAMAVKALQSLDRFETKHQQRSHE
jgi:hypothetical protein